MNVTDEIMIVKGLYVRNGPIPLLQASLHGI